MWSACATDVIPSPDFLRRRLLGALDARARQGADTGTLATDIRRSDAVEELAALGARIRTLPLRADCPYVEPETLDDIFAECEPGALLRDFAAVSPEDAARRARTAFLGSVCGCTLGKPVEVMASHAELRSALEAAGEWPLRDYVGEQVLDALGRRADWETTVRGRIAHVPFDDDISYRVVATVLLERHGASFTQADLRMVWLDNLPAHMTFGPERTRLAFESSIALDGNPQSWTLLPDEHEEWCGAMIRSDAYGWACPGRPALAAELAWRDASWTHRATGVYGAMFVAAALAAAPVVAEPLDMVEVGLAFVPRRSRLHETIRYALGEVRAAGDWLDGCARIAQRYGAYGHCRIHQEVGTLVNTLRFARDVGDGICMQVMQGNDTDSYGATAGSLLGAFHGPDGLDPRWLEPFHYDFRVAMARVHEPSLSRMADRVAALPARLHGERR
jgi:ADP-ribosylglycohydrolase